MKDVTIKVDGLNCANCAKTIETRLYTLPFVSQVVVNMMHQEIHLQVTKWDQASQELVVSTIKSVDDIDVVLNSSQSSKKSVLSNIKLDIKIIIGFITYILSFFIDHPMIKMTLIIFSYILLVYEIAKKSIKGIVHKDFFNENILMLVASLGAIYLQEYREAILLLLFYNIGEMFQDYAIDKSRQSINEAMALKVDKIRLKSDAKIIDVNPDDVKIGDVIVVYPGERVAIDGIVISGNSQVSTSSIDGEFVPVDIHQGEEITSGYINLTSVVEIKVTTLAANSTINQIVDLVQQASSKKTKVEGFMQKFAKIYTPIVFLLACVVAFVPSMISPEQSDLWIHRGLALLVVACPCALLVSIPLCLYAGIGCAGKNGILVKGSNNFEVLNKVDTFVFDKTGTLTKGRFEILDICSYEGSNEELLEIAAYAEFYSNHPIAKSIKSSYKGNIDTTRITNYQEISGVGTTMMIDQNNYYVGNEKILQQHAISIPKIDIIGTIVYVVKNNILLGYIVLGDQLKDNAKEVLDQLREYGIKKIVMLTGDHLLVAHSFDSRLRIDDVVARLTPSGKVHELEQLMNDNHCIAFVGDGLNDAPVIARADVGISMGSLGSDATIGTSDIVILNDNLDAVSRVVAISRRIGLILKENIVFTILFKIIIILIAMNGHLNTWLFTVGDTGVTLLAILNAMRALNIPKNSRYLCYLR